MKELYNAEFTVNHGDVYAYLEIFKMAVSMNVKFTVTVGNYTAEVEHMYLPKAKNSMVNFNMAMAVEDFVNAGKFNFDKTPARRELKDKLLKDAAEMMEFCGETSELNSIDSDFEDAEDCFLWEAIRVGNRNALLVVLEVNGAAAPKIFYNGELYKIGFYSPKFDSLKETANKALDLMLLLGNVCFDEKLDEAVRNYVYGG